MDAFNTVFKPFSYVRVSNALATVVGGFSGRVEAHPLKLKLK
jgi:hypothetical protein